MKEIKIKERIKITQKCKQCIANIVGTGLVSAHEQTTNNKLNANVVGAESISARKENKFRADMESAPTKSKF